MGKYGSKYRYGKKHIVYKYVLNNEVIYIGKSDVGLNRLYDHGKSGDNIDKKYWDEINHAEIFYAEMADARMTDIYESELIRRYHPKCNRAKMHDWDGIALPEPFWTHFNSGADKRIVELEKEIDVMKKTLEDTQHESKYFETQYHRLMDSVDSYMDQINALGFKYEAIKAKYNWAVKMIGKMAEERVNAGCEVCAKWLRDECSQKQ